MFERLAQDMMHVQYKTRGNAKAADIQRAFHSKAVFAAIDVELTFVDDLPRDLRVGFAEPGKSLSGDRAPIQRQRLRSAGLQARPARCGAADQGLA